MPRAEEWEREARDAVRKEAWSLSGPNMVVKVTSLKYGPSAGYDGYITMFKYLWNKTSMQIYNDLGLDREHEQYFRQGARILRFTRLPQSSEYEYDLTAKFPGGLVGHEADQFPPGSDKIHQWKVRKGVSIPVDLVNTIPLGPNDKVPTTWPIKVR